jgi:predicted small secreted protein
MKRTILLLSVIFSTTLTACSTIKGVGQDLQKAGQAIEDAAKK